MAHDQHLPDGLRRGGYCGLVKDNKELFDKTNENFMDKARKECLLEQFAKVASCLSRCARAGLSHKGHVTASWCNQSLDRPWRRFLSSHIRCKGLSKSSGIKSQAQGACTSAHDIARTLTDIHSIEISMQSTDTTLQHQQVTSPTAASGNFSVNQQVMDQFTQRTIQSSFLRKKTGDNNTYSLLQLPGIRGGGIRRERFQTFRNEAVKLLSKFKSGQKNVVIRPSNHRNRHFHEVLILHLCHRHFNSHSSQHKL